MIDIRTRIKYLGFEPFETARAKQSAKGRSTHPFQTNCAERYTWWQRFRLALLLIAGVDLGRLHVPFRKGGNIKQVAARIEAAKQKPKMHKTICDALRRASEAFGDESD